MLSDVLVVLLSKFSAAAAASGTATPSSGVAVPAAAAGADAVANVPSVLFMSEEEAEGLLDSLPPPPAPEWAGVRGEVTAFLAKLREF